MDQIGQKQKAKRANVSSHGQRTVSAREIPLHRDLFGVSDPGTSARRRRRVRAAAVAERQLSEHHSVLSYNEHIKVNTVHINRGQAWR